MKVGVCCFDDLTSAESGWASINGSDPERVKGYGDLSSEALWITNLDYRTFRKLNLTQSPNIFDTQYFRSSLKNIAAENGLQGDNRKLCAFASRVFTRIAKMGRERLGVSLSSPGYRYTSILADRVIPSFARALPDSHRRNDILEATKQCTQANQAMMGKKAPQGSTAQPFIFPRSAYAKWLLELPYPVGSKWEEVKRASNETICGVQDGVAIKGTKAVLDRLTELSEKHAMFLRVSVISMDGFYRPFASFAAGSNHPRSWATLPEVLNLARYAKISIKGGYRLPIGQLDLAEKIGLEGQEYSYSRGLFAENAWVALSNSIYGSDNFTAIGAYLRAYDRIACGRMAELFAGHNYVVGSFGTGRIMVYLRPGEMDTAGQFAFSNGLLAPYHMVNPEEADES